MKVMVVEDDPKLGRFIQRGLQEVAHNAVWARTKQEAMDLYYEGEFDVITLDIGLPDGDGLEFLRHLRSLGQHVPVLILSARDAVEDKIRGLNLGADDYLAKPFSFDELLARLRSIVRRQSSHKKTILEYGPLRMDLVKREVIHEGKKIELTLKEFAILELFLQHPKRVVTRTQLLEKIWNCHFDTQTNMVDVYISRLRGKLRGNAETSSLIRTVRGVGYSLE